jgi:hypothetical protein
MSPGIMAMPPVPLCSMMPKIVSAVPVKSGFHRGRTTMTATSVPIRKHRRMRPVRADGICGEAAYWPA